MPFKEIAQSYNLSLPAEYAAMAYYYAHKAEIEQRDAETAAAIEDVKQRNPSPLEAKLAELLSRLDESVPMLDAVAGALRR